MNYLDSKTTTYKSLPVLPVRAKADSVAKQEFVLPQEMFFEIFQYLSLTNLINSISHVNKLFNHIIKTTVWPHLVKVNDNNLNFVLKNYKFNKFDLSCTGATDENIKLLTNCHTLIFYRCCNVTDDSVKLLGKCHTLDLSYCNITDASVKLLANCHTLDLSYCNITDDSVKLLANCHTLNLSNCRKITDASVKLLGNCHTLDLSYCNLITNESIKYLDNCHKINLRGCYCLSRLS